jgi:hypothetical protein
VDKAAYNLLADTVNFFNSPEGAAVTVATGGAGAMVPAIGRFVTMGFGADAARNAIEAGIQGRWSDALESLGMAGLLGHGAKAEAKAEFPTRRPEPGVVTPSEATARGLEPRELTPADTAQPRDVFDELVSETAVAPKEAPPAAAVSEVATQIRKAVDSYDFDEQHVGHSQLADDLEAIGKLPKPLSEALQNYRDAVEEDRTLYGERSGEPEIYGDRLYKLATEHAAPEIKEMGVSPEAPPAIAPPASCLRKASNVASAVADRLRTAMNGRPPRRPERPQCRDSGRSDRPGGWRQSVESTTGAVAIDVASLFPRLSVRGAPLATPWLRFQSPLIEPDRRISRIRLSDKTSCFRPRKVACADDDGEAAQCAYRAPAVMAFPQPPNPPVAGRRVPRTMQCSSSPFASTWPALRNV